MASRTEFWKHSNLLLLTWQLHSELFLHTCELCSFSHWMMSNVEERRQFWDRFPFRKSVFFFTCEKILCIHGLLRLHVAVFYYCYLSNLLLMFSTMPEKLDHTSQCIRACFLCMECHTLLRMVVPLLSAPVSLSNTWCTQMLCKYVVQTHSCQSWFLPLLLCLYTHFSLPNIPSFSWYMIMERNSSSTGSH